MKLLNIAWSLLNTLGLVAVAWLAMDHTDHAVNRAVSRIEIDIDHHASELERITKFTHTTSELCQKSDGLNQKAFDAYEEQLAWVNRRVDTLIEAVKSVTTK